MHQLMLSDTDVAGVGEVVADVAATIESVEDPRFLDEAATWAHELPRALRSHLNRFRMEAAGSVCVISGYPVDDAGIGPTPADWRDCKDLPATRALEAYFLLCASLLGDPIGWATQQDGYVLHDVLPMKEYQHAQSGMGSEEELTWHTEDAFHPLRAEYIGLFCLRNPDGVQTTFACVEDLELDDDCVGALWRSDFPIRPDLSHLPANGSTQRDLSPAEEELLRSSYEWITRIDFEPEPIEVLFGHRDAPYLRVDPYFMPPPAEEGARSALRTITRQIDRALTGYALRPGDVLFLDNYKAVHGREAFKARCDGTDRWLKRLNIARDLRRSRGRRVSARSRVIY